MALLNSSMGGCQTFVQSISRFYGTVVVKFKKWRRTFVEITLIQGIVESTVP